MFASRSLSATMSRLSVIRFELDSKEPVPGIAQAGNNKTARVHLRINGRRKYRKRRIPRTHGTDAFGRSHQVDQSHMLGAAFKEQIQRGQSAAAGCEHWVDEDDFKPAQILWQAFM